MPRIDTDPKKIDRLLTRGVIECVDRAHLRAALRSGAPLRVKLGFDPTGSKIHLGRAIVLRKLREFQTLGHTAVFIVGDFTAKIGDPSDKLEKRPRLTDAQIKENVKNYKAQVGRIIDLRKIEFVFNSTWLKKLNLADFLSLQRAFTTSQMMTRRNFSARIKKGGDVGLEETSYPLMQGYDSVIVKADVEIGGFDQLFNLKAGRAIQEHRGLPPQDIVMTEMLEGTDGRKMSTSWGNVINIVDEPDDMFGKMMSIKDELITKYFELCTDFTDAEIAALPAHPKERKLRLAHEIVKIYHGSARSPQAGKDAARKAEQQWEAQFSKGEMPEEIPEVAIDAREINIVDLLCAAHLAPSKSEARRLVTQGGVKINGIKKTDPAEIVAIEKDAVIQVGPRKFARIKRG